MIKSPPGTGFLDDGHANRHAVQLIPGFLALTAQLTLANERINQAAVFPNPIPTVLAQWLDFPDAPHH